MKISTLLRIATAGAIASVSGCAQKSVTAPPPSPLATKPAAQAPAVQPPPPAPPAAATQADSRTPNQVKLDSLLAQALRPIYFDYDQSSVKPEGEKILSEIGTLRKRDRSLSVTVEGNTDERGSTEYNLALGERRANTARRWLLSYGVPKSQLNTVSYGKEKPAADGHDEASWSRNRRDEFVSKSL